MTDLTDYMKVVEKDNQRTHKLIADLKKQRDDLLKAAELVQRSEHLDLLDIHAFVAEMTTHFRHISLELFQPDAISAAKEFASKQLDAAIIAARGGE